METSIDWDSIKVTEISELKKVLMELAETLVKFSTLIEKLTGASCELQIEIVSLQFALAIGDFDRIKEVGKRLVFEYDRVLGPNSVYSLPVPPFFSK